MTERIDHAAEALRYLPATGDGMNTGRIAVAQVHATLALVEQQRIANLVALGQFRIVPEDWPAKRVLYYKPVRTSSDGPEAEIREALGIE